MRSGGQGTARSLPTEQYPRFVGLKMGKLEQRVASVRCGTKTGRFETFNLSLIHELESEKVSEWC